MEGGFGHGNQHPATSAAYSYEHSPLTASGWKKLSGSAAQWGSVCLVIQDPGGRAIPPWDVLCSRGWWKLREDGRNKRCLLYPGLDKAPGHVCAQPIGWRKSRDRVQSQWTRALPSGGHTHGETE